ncbi:hypothetical protein yrohd0001_20550 [Yersinia rohdei ATCC 43380]|nr:hypothetical protein yrohd0001_20550 [Yersinia rohdei ATCC 43380]
MVSNQLGEKKRFANTSLLATQYLFGKYLFTLGLFIYDMG